MKKALILDLDNTLYSWMDGFANSFREQVTFLAQSLNVEENIILHDFKPVFKKYNSVEVPNAVYQLPIWNTCGLDEQESKLIQEKSIEVFLDSWKKNIKLFPKVEETLAWARKEGFLIFAYSDAFAFWIDFRLSILNIQQYFDNIFAMSDDKISDSELVINSERHCQITLVEQSEMKPNTLILDRILETYKINKENIYFVGDSITKDIETAKQAGICDIWARYGLDYKRENGRLLSCITPWKKGTGGRNELKKKAIPTYTIERFDEIKNIIAKNGELDMFKGLNLTPQFLDKENIVAKLQLLMHLEKASPYGKGSVFDPLYERILRALRAIPSEHHEAVLALFANTLYCTEQFSTSIMLHLYNTVLHKFDIKPNEFAKECLVLEVDPTGMINDFLRLNKVQGRLDKDAFPREQQLDNFVKKIFLRSRIRDYVLKLGETSTEVVDKIFDEEKFSDDSSQLDKKYWIVLTDNVLSGTSLNSSVKRLCDLANKFNKKPKIIVLARTLTDKALVCFNESFKIEIERKSMFIRYGLLLKKEYTITDTSNECKLFSDSKTIEGIIKASNWLAEQEEFKSDEILEDHKKNSGDDLRFGFKQCGLTFVSAENCPSNSLPLLWYKKNGFYEAPFPRVLSRIGGHSDGKI